MGKSLEYVKSRVQNRQDADLNISFDNVFEVSPRSFLNFDRRGWACGVLESADDAANCNVTIEIKHDPTANFEFLVAESVIQDGSEFAMHDAIRVCLEKIAHAKAFDINVGMPQDPNNCNYFYIIGNIVVANEYGENFSPNEKPGMRQRTTVMIPTVFRFEENKS